MSPSIELQQFSFEGGRTVFTTRAIDGAGRGPTAPARIAEVLRTPAVARLQQVHGDRVIVLPERARCADAASSDGHECFVGDGDALATDRTDVALAVVTADCVPILVADRRGRSVAAIHAGWRGAASRIVARTIEALERAFEVAPADLDVLLGPAAGGCCYEVGEEVVTALRASLDDGRGESHEDSDWLRPGTNNRPHVELRAILRRQLESAGVSPVAIRSHSDCTICRGDLWPSYRREGSSAGRIWAAIALDRKH